MDNLVRGAGEKTVKSVKKAMNIIEVLGENGEMSIGEIHDVLGLDKATIHRLLNTMLEEGFIVQNQETKKYGNSMKFFILGQKLMDKIGLAEIARPFMKELAEKSGETVSLGAAVDFDIVYIDRIQSPSAIKVGLNVGTKVPLYCTGIGKAVLAFMEGGKREHILRSVHFEGFTNKTVKDRETLEGQLKLARSLGYAKDDEEYIAGLYCLGAPVYNHNGEPIGAVSISCLSLLYGDGEVEERYASLVLEAAHQISGRLGYLKK